MTPRVYVAAPYPERARAEAAAATLRAHGLDVCSTWHDHATDAEDPVSRAERCRVLEANLDDLDKASIVLAMLDRGRGRCGLVEIGYALARGAWVVLLCQPGDAPLGIADSHRRVIYCGAGLGQATIDDLRGLTSRLRSRAA